MKEILLVWFDICNFITCYLIDPLVDLIFLIPFIVEDTIYVVSTYKKGKIESINMDKWVYCNSKVYRLKENIKEWFVLIEYK